jgi:hypothetical protein
MLSTPDNNRFRDQTQNASGVSCPQGAKLMTAARNADASLAERWMR